MNTSTAAVAAPKTTPTLREALLTDLGLMTQEQVAAALDVTPHTLMVWRNSGQGPDFVKTGKIILYRKNDVLDWLERQVVPTTRTAR